MVTRRVERFVLFIHILGNLCFGIQENGLCTIWDQNNTRCCANYIYDDTVKGCVECVGRFGLNCSMECPDGFYGRSCNSKCNCSDETCDKISGCLKNTEDGVCYDKENGNYCCTGYMYLENEHKCQECIGRFGVNCSEKCPEGYYGKQCSEKCACNASQCDEILGCQSAPSECLENFDINCTQKCPKESYVKQCNEQCTCNASQCDEILGYRTPPSGNLCFGIQENGTCIQNENNTRCCTNYIYNDTVKGCVECVGKFGHNCSMNCPDGFYGRSCNSKCNCSDETCNKISGCLKNNEDGMCYDKDRNSTYCCTGYMYLKNEHKCQECVGRFGFNCGEKCPEGYYGKRCREKCACNASQCDEILGCLKGPSEIESDKPSIIEDVLWFALPVSLVCGVVVVSLICRYARKYIHHSRIPRNTARNVEALGSDTTCIYAAVTRPKKKPLNGVLQNDATYGNTQSERNDNAETTNNSISSRCPGAQTVHDVDFPCACSELEDVNDDAACITTSPSKDSRNSSSEMESHSDYGCIFPNENEAEDKINQRHQTSLREANSQFYYTLEYCGVMENENNATSQSFQE